MVYDVDGDTLRRLRAEPDPRRGARVDDTAAARSRGRPRLAPVTRLHVLICFFALLFAGWQVIRAHLFFFDPPAILNSYDEGYVVAFARRMLEGSLLPYVDAVSHRGPVLYWVTAIAVALGEPFSWAPVRLLALSATLLNVLLVFLAARRANHVLAGTIAALGIPIALLLGMELPMDGMAFGGELLLNVFALASLGVLVTALRGRHTWQLVVVAGVLAGLAVLTKQIAAALLPAFALWPLAAALSRPDLKRSERYKWAAAFPIGVAIPVAALIARYAVAGELSTLFYYMVTYNSEVYLAPITPQLRTESDHKLILNEITLIALALPVLAWAITRPLTSAASFRDLPRAYDKDGFIATVGLAALLALLFGNAAGRGFHHYFVMHVPWFGLLAGLLLERAIRDVGTSSVKLGALAWSLVLLPGCVLLERGWRWRQERFTAEKATNIAWRNPKEASICKFIQQNSTPRDTLFVWGFTPSLYTSCERHAASRYLYTTFVTGFVPWFDEPRAVEEKRVTPGSRAMLLRELASARPAVIVDAPDMMGDRSISSYPEIAAFVDTHYCSAGTQDGWPVYVLERPGKPCASKARPAASGGEEILDEELLQKPK
jgi:hypothetical protein